MVLKSTHKIVIFSDSFDNWDSYDLYYTCVANDLNSYFVLCNKDEDL